MSQLKKKMKLSIPKNLLLRIRSVVCAEIEPSENTKKQFPEIFEVFPDFKWEILYYPKSGKWRCTCLGYISASRKDRICHHLWEFLKKNNLLEENVLNEIRPKKVRKN